LLDDFGIGDRLNHRPNQLSGGEAQRVAIARALINHPALLLMDEPTGNLDRSRSEKIFQLLEEVHRKRGQTMVVVTHDADIAALAEHRLYLTGGNLRDTPSEHSCP
jgi:ABC-type lipoprotein export system ATPase subunit